MIKLLTFKQFLEEQVYFPGTSDYGYWITNSGEIIPVPYLDHNKIAAEHFNIRRGQASYMHAYHNGWIRVVHEKKKFPGMVDLQFNPLYVSPQAIRTAYHAIRDVMKYHPDTFELKADIGKQSFSGNDARALNKLRTFPVQ